MLDGKKYLQHYKISVPNSKFIVSVQTNSNLKNEVAHWSIVSATVALFVCCLLFL